MRCHGSCRATTVAILGAVACSLAVLSACTHEPAGQGTATVGGSLRPGAVVDWPVPIGAAAAAARACKEGYCLPGDALALVFGRAAQWMAQFAGELRFDAAIGLSQIRNIIDNDDLQRAFDAARAAADSDADHPQRRFWLPEFRSSAEHTAGWPVPADGTRIDSSRVISEALHCSENGWRAETTAYVCGPMRDDGGYESTNALWALAIARANGCLGQAATECVSQLQRELSAAQPAKLEAPKTLDVDLYAGRLLMLLLSGYDKPAIHTWARTLVRAQNADGSWGAVADEDPYRRYHAASASTWALAEWFRYLVAHRGEVAPLGALRMQAPLFAGGPAFWGCALPVGGSADDR